MFSMQVKCNCYECCLVLQADEMKKIFKIPYCESSISVTVHRVGETLFLDGEYDVKGTHAHTSAVPTHASFQMDSSWCQTASLVVAVV